MIKEIWSDCCTSFECPNCKAELIADSQEGPRECDCGLKYWMVANVMVEFPAYTRPSGWLEITCPHCGKKVTYYGAITGMHFSCDKCFRTIDLTSLNPIG